MVDVRTNLNWSKSGIKGSWQSRFLALSLPDPDLFCTLSNPIRSKSSHVLVNNWMDFTNSSKAIVINGHIVEKINRNSILLNLNITSICALILHSTGAFVTSRHHRFYLWSWNRGCALRGVLRLRNIQQDRSTTSVRIINSNYLFPLHGDNNLAKLPVWNPSPSIYWGYVAFAGRRI